MHVFLVTRRHPRRSDGGIIEETAGFAKGAARRVRRNSGGASPPAAGRSACYPAWPRKWLGAVPMMRLNARLNAASES